MAMDSVSLPVVSATAPPQAPPRGGAPARASASPAASAARGARTDAGKASGPHAADASRSFDDVLADVRGAKDDTTSTHTATARADDDTDEPANVSADAGQAQPAVVVVTPVAVPAIVPPHKAAETRHRIERGRGNHDRTGADPVNADGVAPAQSSLPPVAVTVVTVAPQPQTAPAQRVPQEKTVPVAATETLASECTTPSAAAPAAPSSTAAGPATSTKKTVAPSERGSPPRFDVQTERPGTSNVADAVEPVSVTETSDRTSPSLTKAAPHIEAAASERASEQSVDVPSRLVNEQKSAKPPADSVPGTPAADAPALASPVAPQPNDTAARATTSAARRATSRAAAQAVITKAVRQDGPATETPAPASTHQATGEVVRVVPQSSNSSSIGAESGKPSAKLELRRPEVADTVAIAAPGASGHADTAAGEHRSAGQGMAGQDAAPHAKVAAVASATAVVAPAELRQAFERMVREVTSAGPTLDASSGAAVTDQIVRGMQLQVKGNVGEARITLAPEHLGEVVVEMRVEKDGVVATLRADTPAVRGWIATHQDDLRAGLADVGLRLDDLQVSERDSQRGRQQPSADQQPQTPRRPRRTSAGELPRFEVEA